MIIFHHHWLIMFILAMSYTKFKILNTHTHSLTYTHSHTHTYTHTHNPLTLSLTHVHTHTLSLSHTHTLSHKHSHTRTHVHTHTHTHTHTFTHTCLTPRTSSVYFVPVISENVRSFVRWMHFCFNKIHLSTFSLNKLRRRRNDNKVWLRPFSHDNIFLDQS